MKKVLHYIANFVLMLVLIVSTTGFAVYKLHCQCTHHDHFSVFVEASGCHSSDPGHHCSCNCGAKGHAQTCHHGNRCDTSEAHFVKLSADFIASHSLQVEKTLVLEIDANQLLVPVVAMANTEADIFYPVDFSPPRIDSGKKIVTLLHQFKFDDFSSYLIG